MNETLKVQETLFKLNCKTQRDELLDMLKKLDEQKDSRPPEIEEAFLKDKAKIDKLRQALAKKNQDISSIVRAIDEIPARAELLQYERRFVELYELVNEKLKETRKYYELYNTLEDSHRYLSQEVSILNSISEGFPKAMKTKPGKDSFIESFATIIDGVNKTLEHADKELSQQNLTREKLNTKYNSLMEKQRNYFKAVKEFQEECAKNEAYEEILGQEEESESA